MISKSVLDRQRDHLKTGMAMSLNVNRQTLLLIEPIVLKMIGFYTGLRTVEVSVGLSTYLLIRGVSISCPTHFTV